VYLSPDGERFYYGGLQLDGTYVSTMLGSLDDRILAEDPDAQIAVGVTQMWDTTTRQPLGGVGAVAAAFVANEQELWTFQSSGEITYTATADLR
jgi:hypothetical protein